jgi:CRP-like cAMP-binding protein
VRPKALFSVLGGDHLEAASAVVTPLRFAAGERVYEQGRGGSAAFTVRQGIVRFERVSSDGGRRIVRLSGQGALIGQEAMLHRAYAEEAVACTDVEVCRIPRSAIEEFGSREPVVLRELMHRWQAALDAAGEWNAEVTRGTARRRVLMLLHQLQQLSDGEGRIWLPSRLEMSDMLNVAVETASRVVSQLRREGVLQGACVGQAKLDAGKLADALRAGDA